MSDPVRKPGRPAYGFARRNGATLIDWEGEVAQVAYRQGIDPTALIELKRMLNAEMSLTAYSESDYNTLLQRLYEHQGDATQVAADISEEIDLDQIAEALSEPEDLLESEDDAPIIRLINALMTQAVKENASDIHIEPLESRLLVRFRVDGMMREVLSPDRSVASVVVSRIKVMARLDIAEKRLPQDGRISLRIAGRPIDVRVSTIPSSHGERVVLRLLDKQAGRLDLRALGMTEHLYQRVDQLIHRPHGILLVTGPTGSGKTTTLYAGLERLNDRSRNILTVEDPIEYDIDGIGQTQVNPKVEMDFARGLRAILRQDPDVVMVGEIRDLETAQIAVQASLTGHLVLSTLHTNSAIGAVARLKDMGVEPFLLASSLIGIVAQRLVRLLDPESRVAYQASASECAAFGQSPEHLPTLYRPGEGAANPTGYQGRTGIYELIQISETLRQMIHESVSETEMLVEARRHSPGILQDGWEKVTQGLTSVEEVLRVTQQE